MACVIERDKIIVSMALFTVVVTNTLLAVLLYGLCNRKR